MNEHRIGTREEWSAARAELLTREILVGRRTPFAFAIDPDELLVSGCGSRAPSRGCRC